MDPGSEPPMDTSTDGLGQEDHNVPEPSILGGPPPVPLRSRPTSIIRSIKSVSVVGALGSNDRQSIPRNSPSLLSEKNPKLFSLITYKEYRHLAREKYLADLERIKFTRYEEEEVQINLG